MPSGQQQLGFGGMSQWEDQDLSSEEELIVLTLRTGSAGTPLVDNTSYFLNDFIFMMNSQIRPGFM